MKKKTLFFSLFVVFAFASTSFAAFSIEIRGNKATAPQALFAEIVANFFGVDSKVVLDLQSELSPIQIIGSFYLAGEEGTYLLEAAKEFKKGRGWNKFKHRGKKIPPGQLKKRRIPTTLSIEQEIFIRFLGDCYNISEKKAIVWLNYGIPYEEILLCVNFAQRAHISPERVVELRRAGRDWSWFCRTWKISEKDLGSLPKSHRRYYQRKIKIRR